MAHQAHDGLRRVELLGHEGLRACGGRRGRPRPSPRAGAAPGAAAVLVLIVGVGVGAGAVASSSVPAAAISVGGRRRALPVAAVPPAAVAAAAAAAVLGAAAHGAHSPIALVLVHQVGVVGIGVATETGSTTSSSSSSSAVNQLQQFGIDGLPGLLQHPDQLSGLPEVSRREEGISRAFVGAAGRAADTVDVVLGRVRIVIVDDKLDILHILRRRGKKVGVMDSVTGREKIEEEKKS